MRMQTDLNQLLHGPELSHVQLRKIPNSDEFSYKTGIVATQPVDGSLRRLKSTECERSTDNIAVAEPRIVVEVAKRAKLTVRQLRRSSRERRRNLQFGLEKRENGFECGMLCCSLCIGIRIAECRIATGQGAMCDTRKACE